MQPLSQMPAEMPETATRARPVAPWHAIARVFWLVASVLVIGLFLASLPPTEAALRAPSALSTASASAPVGPAPGIYATYQIVLVALAALGFFVVAAMIFWRRSHDGAALFVAFTLVAFGSALPGTLDALVTEHPIWDVPFSMLQAIGWLFLLLFAFLFPDARFVPRWTNLLAGVAAGWVLAFFALAPALVAPRPWLIALTFAIWVGWFALGVLAQAYRYVRVATFAQRQQTRWVILGFLGAISGVLVAVIPHIVLLIFGQRVSIAFGYLLVAFTVATLSSLLLPLAIGIAILRHRLFDIDLIINRTLVYGSLTASLVLIYAVVVFGLQWFAGLVVHQNTSTPAIVASTLLIAALFTPLRRRLQISIDQRFYRRKYSAARTLAAFSATLRNEVDLAQLREQLLHVVDKTMHPAHLSLWLREPHPPHEDTGHPREPGGDP